MQAAIGYQHASAAADARIAAGVGGGLTRGGRGPMRTFGDKAEMPVARHPVPRSANDPERMTPRRADQSTLALDVSVCEVTSCWRRRRGRRRAASGPRSEHQRMEIIMWFGLGIVGLIIWIAIAFWPARVAARKGHSFIGYFCLSLLFFPLSMILAYAVEDRSRVAYG
jgi:hypothetical protein